MFIRKSDYLALVERAARAETRADWLMTRVNQLEIDLGNTRASLTGIAQPVPMLKRESTAPPEDADGDNFEDLGDDLAKKYGVTWDPMGLAISV